MSSGFSGRAPDFYSTTTGRSTMIPMNNPQFQFQHPYHSPLSGILSDGVHRTPSFIGKRPLSEFQQHQQIQPLELYLRNVKPRNYQQIFPSDLRPSLLPIDSTPSTDSTAQQAMLASYLNQVQNSLYQETEQKMMNQLHELEKQLFDDTDDDVDDTVSVVTNSEWSETIQNLIIPSSNNNNNHLSPASSSTTSSCCSSIDSAPVSCPKQLIVEAATAISDKKTDIAVEFLTRLAKVANVNGSSEQKLTAYMVSALRSRVNSTEYPSPVLEMQSKEHRIFTQNLYEVSPCFKLGFMAANLAILEAVADYTENKLHVIDFDIGQGGQYLHLLHALASKKTDTNKPIMLKITAVTEIMGKVDDDKVKSIGDDLKILANKVGICLSFNVIYCKITDLSREKLGVEENEVLAVNFAFKLYKLPDESVTTENLRDALLRRVKRLSPKVVTVVEQELNWNTAGLVARVNEACGYYGALLDSLEATESRDEMGRVKIEEGLSRKIANSVACEGRDRIERCELFGKWRARLSMAGFGPRPMSQLVGDSLLKKLNSGPRGNPGFTVNEQSGGVCFGWMGKTLTVASAWC